MNKCFITLCISTQCMLETSSGEENDVKTVIYCILVRAKARFFAPTWFNDIKVHLIFFRTINYSDNTKTCYLTLLYLGLCGLISAVKYAFMKGLHFRLNKISNKALFMLGVFFFQ